MYISTIDSRASNVSGRIILTNGICPLVSRSRNAFAFCVCPNPVRRHLPTPSTFLLWNYHDNTRVTCYVQHLQKTEQFNSFTMSYIGACGAYELLSEAIIR